MEPVVLQFTPRTQFTDDELFEFCAANKELRIERNQNGQILIMPPTGAASGNQNFTFNAFFGQWVLANKNLGYGFDSSTGFRLANGAMRSPDAAWISNERWEQLSSDEQKKFAPLAPDFVVEIRSEPDALKELQNKMLEWVENGCRLAWLIDPLEQKAYVYTPQGLSETIQTFTEKLNGGDVLPGFELDLAVLK